MLVFLQLEPSFSLYGNSNFLLQFPAFQHFCFSCLAIYQLCVFKPIQTFCFSFSVTQIFW
jgi:hypothetical protein